MIELSYSRISSYRSCPYQHYLRYVERLELDRPIKALSFGTDFHKLLEFKDNPKKLRESLKEIDDKYYEMSPQHQEELGVDYLENLRNIYSDYIEVNAGCPVPEETELEFNIPIARIHGQEVSFKGVIDEVYPNCIGEHKTFNMKPDMITLAMNTQICLYAKALRKLRGHTPKQVIWDYTRNVPASSPVYLESSKRLSNAKSNMITPMSWRRACAEHKITDPDTIRMGDAYSPNISNFFFKITLDIDRNMVNKIWGDFKATAHEIVKNGDTNKIQNVTRDCSWCSYKDICYAGFTGGDVEYTKSKNYREKTERK